MSRSLRWWLINGIGGAAVLFGSFFVTLAVIDANDASVVEEARRGAAVRIKIDPKACAASLVGGLSCERPYEGRYDPATNSWTISGRTSASDAIVTRSDANAPNEPGAITLWGLTAKFDRSGKLTQGGTVIGSVEEVERKSWLSRLFRSGPPIRG
jgi:hypothetical protein